MSEVTASAERRGAGESGNGRRGDGRRPDRWCAIVALCLLATSPAAPAQDTAPSASSSARWTPATAVERALAQHPSTALAAARRREAEETLGEALASRGPLARAVITGLHYDDPIPVSPIHGFGPGLFPPFDDTLVQASVNVSYVLWDSGARAARSRQAEALLDLAGLGFSAAEQALAARVLATYATVLAEHERLAADAARVAALRLERERAALLVTAGKAAEVERLRAEAAVAAAEATQVRSASRLETARLDFARLLGVEADAVSVASLAGLPPGLVEPASRDELAARAVDHSPQVAQARRQVDAAEAARALARTAYFPELRAIGAVQEFANGGLEATTDWNAGLQLVVPLWDGGLTRRRVARATVQRELAAAGVAQAELDAVEAVDRARAALREANARTGALERAVDRLTEVARVQRLLLDAGAGTQVDYLAAEAELAATRADASATRAAAVIAGVDLARATGDLSTDWIRTNLEGGAGASVAATPIPQGSLATIPTGDTP